ncbi:MAG: 2-oxoacid:acceptor oxidoreductase subunit alpha [Thermoproteota archaeon]|nr:2-oxoacid:acceptor oxidoreductase subunit alpha [Thermoproteota archaeon]
MGDISWVIGGPQGSGVDSASHIFIKSIAMSGLHIFGKREYYSNIKGEHSYFTVRVSDKPIRSHIDSINILVTFDGETVLRHSPYLTCNGVLIYDPEIKKKKFEDFHFLDYSSLKRINDILEKNNKSRDFNGILEHLKERNVLLIEMPYFDLIKDFSEKTNDHTLSKLARITNVMSLASSLALLNFDTKIMENGIRAIFSNKPKVANININAANYAYNYVKVKYENTVKEFVSDLVYEKAPEKRIIAQGNQTSPLGKIVAGCRFQTYYPITPATDDSEFLEHNQIFKQTDNNNGSVVVIQTEDEIAAITMAIGASLTGTRSCTSTSGPGFSLMAEALGWAGINEVPLVVSLYQRAGPSTGLPTRHEQGDLLFAINAGHGEFPKVVYASGDIEESFYDTVKVFNYAEKFQLPVIHMLDKYIANSIITCNIFDYKNIKIERGKFVDNLSESTENSIQHFKRFSLENGPISPRVPLGTRNGIFWNTGDEHDEQGHITEDPYIRKEMMEKRMSKLKLVMDHIPSNDQIKIEFEDQYKENVKDIVIMLSWGSTKGAILDSLEQLSPQHPDVKFMFIQIKLLHPFPSMILENTIKNSIEKEKSKQKSKNQSNSNISSTIITIEMNYTSQLDVLLKQNTSINSDYKIIKYNGRPISNSELHEAIIKVIKKNSEKRLILENGV